MDLGGNIACLPDAPAGRNAYRIGIRHPLHPSEVLAQVELRDACIATSGDYELRIILEGKSIGHIMDPRTGRPAAGRLAVTVITRRGLDSDVYSTAIFVAGPAVAARLRARDPECRLLLCRPDASPAGFRADWLPAPPPLEFTLQCGTCRPGDPSQGGKWAVQRKRRLPPKQPTLV
ncbi:MAG: FAD:protein FMN transferase [Lentisphaeria bacterium]